MRKKKAAEPSPLSAPNTKAVGASSHRIAAVRIRGFKGIHDSTLLELRPNVVLLGRNATGKSSLLEAIEFVSRVITQGVSAAGEPWGGTRHLIRKESHQWDALNGKLVKFRKDRASDPALEVSLRLAPGISGEPQTVYTLTVAYSIGEETCRIVGESLTVGERVLLSRSEKEVTIRKLREGSQEYHDSGKLDGSSSFLMRPFFPGLYEFFEMGVIPFARMSTTAMHPKLAPEASGWNAGRDSGSFAEALGALNRRKDGPAALKAVNKEISSVLPNSPIATPRRMASGTDVSVAYAEFQEKGNLPLPAWLASHGTQRVMSLFLRVSAVTRPSVLLLEDFEDGLDPFTLSRLVGEMRSLWTQRNCQVILTTHSPFILSSFEPDDLFYVKRGVMGAEFYRPSAYSGFLDRIGYQDVGTIYTTQVFEDMLAETTLAPAERSKVRVPRSTAKQVADAVLKAFNSAEEIRPSHAVEFPSKGTRRLPTKKGTNKKEVAT